MHSPSTRTRLPALVGLTVIGLLALIALAASVQAAVPVSAEDSEAAPPAAQGTIAIECGGYDADGTLVSAEAAAIDHAAVDEFGVPSIPPACGGYTEDGRFIGDD